MRPTYCAESASGRPGARLTMACLLTAAVAVVPACGGSETALGPAPPSNVATAHGVRLLLEPGWKQAEKVLTPKLLNPKELISVGTFEMRPGGECAQLPGNAFADMGETDGLITIMQRAGKKPGYPPRPAHFRVGDSPGAFECAPADLNASSFIFRESGRRFYAHAVLGKRGPHEEAEAILDSFRAEETAGSISLSAQQIPAEEAPFHLPDGRTVYLRTDRTEIDPGSSRFEIGTCPGDLAVKTALPLNKSGDNPSSSITFHEGRGKETVTYSVYNYASSPIRRSFLIACAPRSSVDEG